MAVKIICGYDDPEFPIYENLFWNFCPDDWDYMIIGDVEHQVADLGQNLAIFEYQIKKIGSVWVAVTYHS